MIELLLLVSGLVFLWKFSASTSAIATGAETKTQVWAEKVISNSVVERQQNYKEFQEATKTYDSIVSHETFMKELKGK